MNSMTKSIFAAGILGVAVGFAAPNGSTAMAAELGAKDQTIKLAINEWTGQHVTTHIAGEILEKMGYNVEYVTAGYLPQFPAIGQGDLHASLEVWNNLVDEGFEKLKETGDIVDLGLLGLDTQEGWMYPIYMEEVCPGLPDYKALANCTDKLATAETFPEGRILAYPADWGTRSADKIKGLGLPYKAVPAGGEGALVAELKSAVTAKRPLVMEFWGPHWVLAEVDVGWVTGMPEWASACETEPSWGENKDAVHDCGFVLPAVTKVVSKDFGSTWPAALKFVKVYQVDAKQQAKMMFAIDQSGEKLEDVVAAWVADNEATWKPWMDGAMN